MVIGTYRLSTGTFQNFRFLSNKKTEGRVLDTFNVCIVLPIKFQLASGIGANVRSENNVDLRTMRLSYANEW